MGNVFPLFQPIAVDVPEDPGTRVTTAIAYIMALTAQFERRIKELAIRLDAIDTVIDTFDDIDSQQGLLRQKIAAKH
jgi:hypothetical protein